MEKHWLIRWLTRGVWCLLLMGMAASVNGADQCTANLAYPVQSHASPGLLTMTGQSSITGASNTAFPFLSSNIQAQASCNGGGKWVWNGSLVWQSNCSVTGSLASAINGLQFESDPGDFPADPADFPSYSSSWYSPSCQGVSTTLSGGTYSSVSWGNAICTMTLVSGQTYYFQSLTISSGNSLNLNGATVYVGSLYIDSSASGMYGSGTVYASAVSVQGNGKLQNASVKVYETLAVSVNTLTNVSAVFQPHYLASMTLGNQAQIYIQPGAWSIKQLTMTDNSQLIQKGLGTLNLYGLTMSTSTAILPYSGTRTDLTVKMYQTLTMSDNAYINGYIQAHYLNNFTHYNTSSYINFYFTGGTHWINNLTLQGTNDQFIFDSGTAANVYLNSALTLTGQMKMNSGGDPNNLMLLAFGAVNLSGNATLNSIVYINSNDLTMANQAVLTGLVSSVNVTLSDNAQIITGTYGGSWPGVCDSNYACFTDDFNRTSIGSNWVINGSSSSTLPSIVSNRLRMTINTTNQATSATYQKLFPAAGNLVTVEFDHAAYGSSGSGADGMAVVLSDATVTPQPGSYGGPLGYGYKPGISGFAGGWLGMGLDEYGNYSTEYAANGPGFISQAVAIRGSGSGTSGYAYLQGTSTLNPTISRGVSNPSTLYRYRLTVDSRTSGSAMVKVERNTGSGYQTLIPFFNALAYSGQAALPQNFYLSLTGSTGTVTNYHELDNISICALKSNDIGQQIDHFEFDLPSSALTCTPATITVRACLDSACSALYTGSVSATLTPANSSTGGWVGGNPVTFSGGTAQISLQQGVASSVSIGVTGAVPNVKPLSQTLCRIGSGSLSAANCTLTYADSGFVFNIPNKVAGQPATGVAFQAVKKSDTTQTCVPAFASTTKSIAFWSDYISPGASNRVASLPISVNGTNVGTTSGAATTLNLSFDATGTSTLSVDYLDAGQMQLNAQYTGSSATADPGLVMTGSDQFVSAPAGLCLQPATTCSAGNSSCPAYVHAGDVFNLAISPRVYSSTSSTLCSNAVTPSFALNGITLGSSLIAPSGGNNATVGTSSYNHVSAANGTNTVSQSLSEVGVFSLTATPPSYMGMSIPSTQSQPVGRIVPYNFYVSSGTMTPYCNSLQDYMGRSIPTSYTVLARNSLGVTTQNYFGAFAPGTVSLVAGSSSADLSSRLSAAAQTGWVSGALSTSSGASTMFSRGATPDGPYYPLNVGVTVTPNDTLTIPLSGANLLAGTASCSGNCTATQIGTLDMRYGRLHPTSGRSAPNAGLSLPLLLEYYNGSNWTQNLQDSCTALNLTTAGAWTFDRTYNTSTAQLTLNGNATSQLSLSAGPTKPTTTGTSSATAQQGYLWLNFTAPGVTDRVNYQITGTPNWLFFDWNGDGSQSAADISGWAFFNQWRGSDRVIYRRETSQ